MQKKKENLIDKIVKRNYQSELEDILEKKYFEENAKNLLLSTLYKIEAGYKDYETVKIDVDTKEEYISYFLDAIAFNCDDIKLVKLNSKESEILGNKTFLVEKNKKRIICYPIERKLLYCISKISRKTKIIKDNYPIINKTLSDLINTGANIDMVEPLRDFNGYSWTTVTSEIESIKHNLAYQNLRILLGNEFLNKWLNNHEFIIDYMERFVTKMETLYGKKLSDEFIEQLKILSVLLEIKYDKKSKEQLMKIKKQVEEKLEQLKDNKTFVENITNEKRRITEEIKRIDETINNKMLLQEEYKERNKDLPLEEKIFSLRILSKMMVEERENKINKIEKLNELLVPKKFIEYKEDLQEKEKYLKLLDIEELEKEINKVSIKLQKIFLKCFEVKVNNSNTKQEIQKLVKTYRYYLNLPFKEDENISKVKEIEQTKEETSKKLLQKAYKLKALEEVSKNEEINYKILKKVFDTRSINLEELCVKIIKEKDKYFMQTFDEKLAEEKIELEELENIAKKELELKVGKKIKIFS